MKIRFSLSDRFKRYIFIINVFEKVALNTSNKKMEKQFFSTIKYNEKKGVCKSDKSYL